MLVPKVALVLNAPLLPLATVGVRLTTPVVLPVKVIPLLVPLAFAAMPLPEEVPETEPLPALALSPL